MRPFRTRAQQAAIDKPSKKAIRAAISAFAPFDGAEPELAKKQPRRKLTEDSLDGLWGDKDE